MEVCCTTQLYNNQLHEDRSMIVIAHYSDESTTFIALFQYPCLILFSMIMMFYLERDIVPLFLELLLHA